MKLTFKPRSREKLIERANRNSITHLIKELKTTDEKRELVRERNPYLYVFGEHLVAQGGRSYEEYINHLYLGEMK